MAYLLLVERLERQVLAEQQMVATLAAAGAQGVEVPDFDARQGEFDEWLCSEPVLRVVDAEQAELMSVLGVA